MRIWTTTNGFKPHCLSERDGWESAVPRCWYLPPFWHQPHRHLLFSNPFSPTVSTCWKTSPLHPLSGHLCPARPALPTKNSISRRHGISQWRKITKLWSLKSSWWRWQSQAIGCCIPPLWILAARAIDSFSGSRAVWRSGQGCAGPQTGMQSLWTPHLTMWQSSGRPRTSWFMLPKEWSESHIDKTAKRSMLSCKKRQQRTRL